MFINYFKKFKTIVTVYRHDGYEALQNIMRIIHQINIENYVDLQISKKSLSANFPVHFNNFVTFVERVT